MAVLSGDTAMDLIPGRNKRAPLDGDWRLFCCPTTLAPFSKQVVIAIFARFAPFIATKPSKQVIPIRLHFSEKLYGGHSSNEGSAPCLVVICASVNSFINSEFFFEILSVPSADWHLELA